MLHIALLTLPLEATELTEQEHCPTTCDLDRIIRRADVVAASRGGLSRLSRASGLGVSTVSAVIRGRSRNPTLRVLTAIERGLQILEKNKEGGTR